MLPKIYVRTALADTPANGKIWEANSSADFQDRLDHAQCGDVIKLQAGVTFTGVFKLPAKSCDDDHWIIIRTSAADGTLPPEGARLTPCYAGVVSLPARPRYPCPSAVNVMPTIFAGGSQAFVTQSGAAYYRLIGLNITHPPGMPNGQPDTLVAFTGGSGLPHHMIIDRCWIHGDATSATKRGIAMNGSYLAVVDSTITDVHMVNTDTQGLAAWTGTGPLKIVNNFIEGGSSSLLFGGAGSQVTPRDIEIRGNHLFKPLSWQLGNPNFIGVRFNCKIALESKNSSRVLIEGNVLENSWGGPQGGDGDAVWLGPKSQGNACPLCEVNDVTFRYNIIRHAGAGIYIFDAPSDAGGVAQQASRYSIHDNLLEDIRRDYAGPGTGKGLLFRFLGTASFLPPRDVSVQHNTGITDGGILQVLTIPEAPLTNFVFRDNLVANGQVAISGCRTRLGSDVLDDCAHGYAFVNNVIVDSEGDFPRSNGSYRKEKDKKFNLYPKKWRDVGFVSWGENSAPDYRLCTASGQPAASCSAASPYASAATDSKDVGADVEKIYQLTQKAE